MLARTYLHVNLAIKKNENVDELILQVDGSQIAYIDETATVEILPLRLFH
jgi:hypothetical protein